MTAGIIKIPMQMAIDDTMKMLRLRADCTDAIVILMNDRTSECKVSTMRGDTNRAEMLLQRTMQALNRQKANKSGIITV